MRTGENEREGIFDDEGAQRDRSEERDGEFGYFIQVVIKYRIQTEEGGCKLSNLQHNQGG